MENIFYGKYRRISIVIYAILLLAWLVFIFNNSAASGVESAAQSSRVLEFLRNVLSDFSSEVMVDVSVVRTTAHFIEFFILGVLYYIGTFFFRHHKVSLFIHSLSLSLFTAFADETVQLFALDRGSEVIDIWTDFLGALTAHILSFAIYYTLKYFKTASK